MKQVPEENRNLVISTQANSQRVTISLCDSGCGISEENSSRLFDAFYTTKTQGMGMGLFALQNYCRSAQRRDFRSTERRLRDHLRRITPHS